MMRTLLGIEFLSRESTRHDSAVTMVTERAMTRAPLSSTVTASEEHIPSTSTVIGLTLNRGFSMVSLSFAFICYSSAFVR